MNRQLNRLALVAIALIGALVVATTYWQTWASAGLKDRQDNAIERVVQFTIARGLIEGFGKKAVFATNVKQHRGSETLYFRRYPLHGLAAVLDRALHGHSVAAEETQRAEDDFLAAEPEGQLAAVLDRDGLGHLDPGSAQHHGHQPGGDGPCHRLSVPATAGDATRRHRRCGAGEHARRQRHGQRPRHRSANRVHPSARHRLRARPLAQRRHRLAERGPGAPRA